MPSDSFAYRSEDNASLVAQALSDQGEAALRSGDLPIAATTLQKAVVLWRGVTEPLSLAKALNNLAITYATMNEPERAVPLLSEAVELFGESGNVAGQATALNALGAVYSDMGSYEQALVHLRSALSLRRQAGDSTGEAITLDLLARVSTNRGERLAALGYRREQVQAAIAAGDRKVEALALVNLGKALSSTGYDAEAASTLERAAAIHEQLGCTSEAGQTLLALAQAHFDAGDMAAAVGPVERALPMLREAGAWDARAAQWESFLFGQRVRQQIPGALAQWRHGDPAGMQSVVDAAKARLATPGDPNSQVMNPVLQMLAASAAQLAGMSPPQRQPAFSQPSTDEVAAKDTRSTPDLISALQSSQAPERRKAALALGVRGDLGCVEPLIEACEDRNQWVRMAAVRSLGKLKDARALDALCKRVEEDRDKEVRRSAATALGSLGDQRAVRALTFALTDSYFRTVESAEKALRKLKATPDPSTFLALLAHNDPVRRFGAARRLARLADVRSIGPLIQEVENPAQTLQVRVELLKALAQLKDRRGAEAAMRVLESVPRPFGQAPGVDTNVHLLKAALHVIAATADPAGLASMTPRLVALMSDGNPYVRHGVVRALGAVGDESAIPHLERIQQSDEGIVHLTTEAGQQTIRLRSAALEAISRVRSRVS